MAAAATYALVLEDSKRSTTLTALALDLALSGFLSQYLGSLSNNDLLYLSVF